MLLLFSRSEVDRPLTVATIHCGFSASRLLQSRATAELIPTELNRAMWELSLKGAA